MTQPIKTKKKKKKNTLYSYSHIKEKLTGSPTHRPIYGPSSRSSRMLFVDTHQWSHGLREISIWPRLRHMGEVDLWFRRHEVEVAKLGLVLDGHGSNPSKPRCGPLQWDQGADVNEAFGSDQRLRLTTQGLPHIQRSL